MKRTIAVLLAISFFACNMNYEKTSSGLPYKIFRGKGGEKPKPGEFMKFNFEYTLEDRDSVFQSTYSTFPAYSALDTGQRTVYTYMEVLPLMSVGDSAVISISIDSLKSKGLIQEYTPVFAKGQMLTAKVKLLQVFKDEKAVVEDYNKSLEQEKSNEVKAVEQYMTKKNLKGQKTKSGVYVVVNNPGDQTMKADSGKVAVIMYKGYLQSNGKVFDTNLDSSKGHTGPIEIPIGRPGSIQGISDGLMYFGKGGKGTILIPAMLGYGPQGNGGEIPPFSNIAFDVEVTDVKDLPPMQGDPRMQQAPQQGGNH